MPPVLQPLRRQTRIRRWDACARSWGFSCGHCTRAGEPKAIALRYVSLSRLTRAPDGESGYFGPSGTKVWIRLTQDSIARLAPMSGWKDLTYRRLDLPIRARSPKLIGPRSLADEAAMVL